MTAKTTKLAQAFSVSYGVCDTEMYVESTSGFLENGNVIVSDGTHTATVTYGSIKDNVFGDCMLSHGNNATYPIGLGVTITKTPYYAELKNIYSLTGITPEQKADMMLQLLGLTTDVQKWCDAVQVVMNDDTQGRRWTNPDTHEVVFLDYETYGIPANAYLKKYSLNFVGTMNRWYYEQ